MIILGINVRVTVKVKIKFNPDFVCANLQDKLRQKFLIQEGLKNLRPKIPEDILCLSIFLDVQNYPFFICH